MHEVKRHVLKDAFFHSVFVHDVHGHLVDDAQSAKRMQESREVFTMIGTSQTTLLAIRIDERDLGYKARHGGVVDA